MNKRSLFFAVTLLLAVPVFVRAGGDPDGHVSPLPENIQEFVAAGVDVANDFVEVVDQSGKKFRMKMKKGFKAALHAPQKGIQAAAISASNLMNRIAHGKNWREKLAAAVQAPAEPVKIVLQTTPTDWFTWMIQRRPSDLWHHKKIVAFFTAVIALDLAILYSVRKGYESETVQKRIRALKRGLNRVLRRQAAAEKKTVEVV